MTQHAPAHWSGHWSRELSRELSREWQAQWAAQWSGRPDRAGTARDGNVRIGDAERDEAVSALGEHFAAGRLTKDEFDERSDQVTRARFAGELVPVFADLPEVAPARPQQQRRRQGPPPFVWVLPFLMLGMVVTAFVLTAPWLLWLGFFLFLFGGGRRWGRRY